MWHLTTVRVQSECGMSFESYGVRKNSTIINDISLDKAKTEEFVDLLNRLDASEIHAYDLVEDFLGR